MYLDVILALRGSIFLTVESLTRFYSILQRGTRCCARVKWRGQIATVDYRRPTTSADCNLNKLSLILVRVVDAPSANKHQRQRPGPRRSWRTLGAGNIRDIPRARSYNIYLVARYPHQMLPSRDLDFATSVRSLFRDRLMLIENKRGLVYFVSRFTSCF